MLPHRDCLRLSNDIRSGFVAGAATLGKNVHCNNGTRFNLFIRWLARSLIRSFIHSFICLCPSLRFIYSAVLNEVQRGKQAGTQAHRRTDERMEGRVAPRTEGQAKLTKAKEGKQRKTTQTGKEKRLRDKAG